MNNWKLLPKQFDIQRTITVCKLIYAWFSFTCFETLFEFIFAENILFYLPLLFNIIFQDSSMASLAVDVYFYFLLFEKKCISLFYA